MRDYADENNNENKAVLDAFDNEPGYYSQVIKSMLSPGHETELIYWLQNVGLLPQVQMCPNARSCEGCNKSMEWVPAKVSDYFQWKCKACSAKKTIRENSIFHKVRCNLKTAIRILLAWCKGYDFETVENILGVKKSVIKALYDAVGTLVKKYLKNNFPNQKIGGPGTVVIIDTYPEGCMNNARPIRGNRPILCIAEAKNIPPLYWFEALDRFNRNNAEQISSVRDHVLKTIEDVILPGTVLVTRLDSTLCSFHDVQCLRHIYPTIVSVEAMSRFDNLHTNILGNLETIWKLALDVCEEAQLFSYEQVPNFLISQMWRSRFQTESFEMLMNSLIDIN